MTNETETGRKINKNKLLSLHLCFNNATAPIWIECHCSKPNHYHSHLQCSKFYTFLKLLTIHICNWGCCYLYFGIIYY